MVSKIAVVLSAVAIVAALPGVVQPSTSNVAKCNVGSLHCCNSIQNIDSKEAQTQAGLAGLAIGTVSGLVGLHCNPITGIGAGGANCNASPACCSGNTFKGLVTLGCTPANVNV